MTDAEWESIRPLLPVPGWLRGRVPRAAETRRGADSWRDRLAVRQGGGRRRLGQPRLRRRLENRDQAASRKKKGSGGGRPASCDADLYKERNTVERLINKLKAWRGIATPYEKNPPHSYLAGLHLRVSDLDQRPHPHTPMITTGYAPLD